MLQAVVLLAFLLQPTDGSITSNLRPRNSDLTKIKCDALPYRTVYLIMNCYFVIDADVDKEQTSKQCWRILKGATFTGSPPDEVYSTVFEDKNDFLRNGASTGSKKKAMCVYDLEAFSSDFAVANQTSSEGGSSRSGQLIKYDLPTWHSHQFKFAVGQTVVVRATSLGSKEFAMDLHTGDSISLHIDFRFYSDIFILDTFQQGRWHSVYNTPIPLRQNEPFEIRIRAQVDHFQIFVEQGTTLKEYPFKYWEALSRVNWLIIGGSMGEAGTVNYVHLGEKYTPLPAPSALVNELPVCKRELSRDACKKEEGNKTQSLAGCKALVISGQSQDNVYQMMIDFLLKNGDIALRFTPNFKYGNVAIAAVTKGGQFASKVQTLGIAPFKRRVPFEVAFVREPCAFQIYVNGTHYATFPHHFPPSEIVRIQVQWMNNIDIQIKSPALTETPSTSSEGQLITYDLPQYYRHQFKIKLGQTIVVRMTFRAVSIFAIDLHTGGSIPFHMDTRFATGVFSLNNFMTGHWDSGETQPTSIRMNQPFEIRIVARETDFQVFIDEKAFATYMYRVALDQINYFILDIDGTGSLDYLHLGEQYTPVVRPSAVNKGLPRCQQEESKSGVCNREQSSTNMTLAGCKSLVIAGQSSDGDLILIDFLLKNGDIALRFNPNFKTGTVVLTSAKGGQWATDGKTLSIDPFKRKTRFEVAFTRDHCAFQIYVDGAPFASFPHRYPASEIATVQFRYINNLDIQIK